jgi:hypothetical protein
VKQAIWIAFADLFLDTDVRLHYAHIAWVAAQSPFSLPQLKDILDQEVTPALQSNLLGVAGDWAGFPDDWVIRQVEATTAKSKWLRAPRMVNMDRHWSVLASLITLMRETPEAERETFRRVLRLLISLFLVKREGGSENFPGWSPQALEALFRQRLTPLFLPTCRDLARESPSVYPSEQEIEANWQAFLLTIPKQT